VETLLDVAEISVGEGFYSFVRQSKIRREVVFLSLIDE